MSKAQKTFIKNKPKKDFQISTHISLPNKYAFIQVSKAASSSVKWALQTLEFAKTSWHVTNVNNKFLSPHISPYQVDDETLDKIFFSDSFKRVTFVRNPFTRILSCYLHRIVAKPRSASNKALMKLTGGRGGADVSFDEFVEIICAQQSKEQEAHWRCQSDDLCFDSIRYDFVGKVENIDTDIKELIALLYGDQGLEKLIENGFKDASPMKNDTQAKLKQFYSNKKTVDLIRNRFKTDFENFGYSMDI